MGLGFDVVLHPPRPSCHSGLLLGAVAVVATLASATGASKVLNYLASFIGVYALRFTLASIVYIYG